MNGGCKPTAFIESTRRLVNVKSEDFFTHHNHWSNIIILYTLYIPALWNANERFACELRLDQRPHSPAALYGANPLSLAFGLKIISINFPIDQSISPVSACDLPILSCLSSLRDNQPSTADWYNYFYFSVTYLYKDTVTSIKLPISVVVHISTSHVERDCFRSAILNKMLDDKIVRFAWPSQGLQRVQLPHSVPTCCTLLVK